LFGNISNSIQFFIRSEPKMVWSKGYYFPFPHKNHCRLRNYHFSSQHHLPTMLNIVLFGPPGAGKGTQSAKLIEKYQLVHLSTGDIFRANIKGGTELGVLAKSFIDKGQLVPDEVTIGMLASEVNKATDPKGFIFDGFPRTSAQAAALDELLQSKGTSIHMMLALEVEEEELRKRLLIRGKDSGRADDQDPAVIQKRIDVYNAETMPVKDYYSAQNKYKGIQGIGEIDHIFAALCAEIDQA